MNKGWQTNYEAGKKAFEKKKFREARRCLEAVANEKDTFADVFNMLGLCYYNEGLHKDAINAFQKALKINPHYSEAALSLAVVLNETGELEKASQVYAKAKESENVEEDSYLDPYVKGKIANMHSELGSIYKDLTLYSEACLEYKKALALRPDFVDIRTNLGIVYREMDDHNKSIEALKSAIDCNPHFIQARTHLGLTYYIKGEKENAKNEWKKVLAMNPKDKLANMYMNLIIAEIK